MTDETKALAIPQPADLTELSAMVDFPLDTLDVEWLDLRETIAPQGAIVKADSLVGQTITIYRARRFKSRYGKENEPKWAYWCVVRSRDTGELYNTVFGGAVIVEVIDAWVNLQIAMGKAKSMADDEMVEYLKSIGGGKALTFPLDRKPTPNGKAYYCVKEELAQ